ncbi:MAG: hypothetical protein JWO81_3322 [Alphaproteobacteria bacterium]|nr:hypothetical protein [Alphaproteobacteria bacterium]
MWRPELIGLTMTRTKRLLASASVLAVAAFAASPASAAGTAAGSTITNTVTVDFKVGTVSQTQQSASDSFTVDRKINLTVSEIGSATTSVSPGQTAVVTAFSVTNASNATLDFALAATQLVGGTAAHGGTDNFNVSNVKMYVDTDNNGTFNAGDTQVTYLDQVAADASITVFVVADVPLGRSTGDVADVRLTATAAEATTAGTLGATVTQTVGANTAAMDTVFADTATTNGNVALDGAAFADDDYTVLAAALTATKTSKIISDPINGSTNPKMIPGAVVEYCIAVSNAAGSAAATSVNISDTLPAQTLFVAGSIKVNATVSGTTCSGGAAGGSYAAGPPAVVSGTLGTINPGASSGFVFQVSVN